MDRRANMVSGKGNKCGGREEWTNQAKGIRRILENQELEIESYDEELVRKLIDKIIVHDEILKVIFKSGFEVEIHW